MAQWDPKYIKKLQAKRSNEIVTHEEWNKIFNLLIDQGNWNSTALFDAVNQGNVVVQKAEYADNAGKLQGYTADYFAEKRTTLGMYDMYENAGHEYYTPSEDWQPANKKYVDKTFDEYSYLYRNGIVLLGQYDGYGEFYENHPTGSKGEAWLVGTDIMLWEHRYSYWKNVGNLKGDSGSRGDNGVGIPRYGADGQYLMKKGSTDFETEWRTVQMANVIQSDTVRNFHIGAAAPVYSEPYDIWFKV